MSSINILFVLNPASGPKDDDFKTVIQDYFKDKSNFSVNYFVPDWDNSPQEQLKNSLERSIDIVVASGGDGTVKFVAECIYGTKFKLGILPTGSANGLAKNLDIPIDLIQALDIIAAGNTMQVSSLTVNDQFCIHLADIGLNAAIVKRFEQQKSRGIWGYIKAFYAVVFKQKRVRGKITTDKDTFTSFFYMLVFCNATGYGTGLVINPEGKLDDDVFEIVRVRKLSLLEGLRLYWGQDKPNPEFAKISTCKKVQVDLFREVHLQVDGEYLGKTNQVNAELNPIFIETLVP